MSDIDLEKFWLIDKDLIDNHVDLKKLMVDLDDYMSSVGHAGSLKSLNRLYSDLEVVNGAYVDARKSMARIKREIKNDL